MITFAQPGLWWLLAAAAVPVLIHLAHRRRYHRQEWGAMRYLRLSHERHRVRLRVERLVLLAVRTLCLLALALAALGPQVQLAGNGEGTQLARRGRTAAVLLIDDSASTAAPQTEPALVRAQALAMAYLNTLEAGDEVSVLALSQLDAPVAEPLVDRDAARRQVQVLTPTALASDWPRLVSAGLDQFGRHRNPQCELVLIADGRADGFETGDNHGSNDHAWESVRRRLSSHAEATAGSAARPQVLVLAPVAAPVQRNLSIHALSLSRTVVAVGAPIAIRVTLAATGVAFPTASVQLRIDGRVVAEQAIALRANATQDAVFTHVFAQSGSYLLEAVLPGGRDDFPADDRRAVAVQAETDLPVLLVEGVSPQASDGVDGARGLDGSLGLMAAALDPGGDARDIFRPRRLPFTALDDAALAGVRAVVLGDVPALEPAAVTALERFVVAGGGVLVALGPHCDPATCNRAWWRGGDGFLPARLQTTPEHAERDATTRALRPVPVTPGHPALAAFVGDANAAWHDVDVRRYLALDSDDDVLLRVLRLDDGGTLLAERARGRGRVALFTSDLAGAWNDLPYREAFVPLVRALVAHLGATVLPPRNLRVGEPLVWLGGVAPDQNTDAGKNRSPSALGEVRCESGDGTVLPLQAGVYEGRPALFSGALMQPGGFCVINGSAVDDHHRRSWYAATLDVRETALTPWTDSDLATLFAGCAWRRASTPGQVADMLHGADVGYAWWPSLLAVAIMAFFAESVWLWTLERRWAQQLAATTEAARA